MIRCTHIGHVTLFIRLTLHLGKSFFGHYKVVFLDMGWFKKIINGSSHKSSSDGCSEHEDDGDIDCAIALSLEDEDKKRKQVADIETQLNEDELLARAMQESLAIETPPQSGNGYGNGHGSGFGNGYGSSYGNGYGSLYGNGYGSIYGNGYGIGYENGYGSAYGNGSIYQPIPLPFSHSTGYRICVGCHSEIGLGRFLSCMGGIWHPECFRCRACNIPIADYEFSMTESYPYHKSCYKEQHHPKCDVCKQFIPTNAAGFIEYREHPFWVQKYCPCHERDGTPRCCSCERMEPCGTQYFVLEDGRKLCLECLESATMDTSECQPLYHDIQNFYEQLDMKVRQRVPLLLVERHALNEAMEGEKSGHHHVPETRGLCLSEEQTISTILRRSRGRVKEPRKLTRCCEVTAVLILYGLPRLLTGSILAHEMMHAWLRLQGYRIPNQFVEEGICQVLACMWLDNELQSLGVSSSITSSSSPSSASSSSSSGGSFYSWCKKPLSPIERRLGEFFRHQLLSDTSPVYGEGFRAGNQAVMRYGLGYTLQHIRMTGSFPP